MPSNPISKTDASRIQSTQDKAGRDTGKNTFASRVQSVADKNDNACGQAQSGGQAQRGHVQSGSDQEKK